MKSGKQKRRKVNYLKAWQANRSSSGYKVCSFLPWYGQWPAPLTQTAERNLICFSVTWSWVWIITTQDPKASNSPKTTYFQKEVTWYLFVLSPYSVWSICSKPSQNVIHVGPLQKPGKILWVAWAGTLLQLAHVCRDGWPWSQVLWVNLTTNC